jgi:hypothetical protein
VEGGKADSKNAKGKKRRKKKRRRVQTAQKKEKRREKRNLYHSEFTEVEAPICLVS